MKTKTLIFLMSLVVTGLATSCQPKQSEGNKVAISTNPTPASDQIKDEVNKLVNSLPTNSETVQLINSTGAAYLAGFTGEDMKTSDLLTRNDKAKAYGTIIFDLAYTHVYNQTETFSKLVKIFEALTNELGFQELSDSQKKFKDRYQANKNNQDSLNAIVNDILSTTNNFVQKNGSAVDISLVFAGAMVKSLHIISYLTLFASDKEKLMDILKKQKDVLNTSCEILKKTSDNPDVAQFYKALLPINDLFKATESFNTQSVEKINNLTGFITR